ncbi:MAG: hypothetical protein MUC50_16575 [Myxococcota bacterium]|nr:hypothetical protein [Myxococcota bacterium]
MFVVTQIGKPLEPKTSISASEANQAAFLAVKDIGKAQTAYQKTDWDGDGQKKFALFVVHLWRTGRKNKEPVDVNLIPEELAVARLSDFAYRGYSFRDLHCQMIGDDSSPSTPPQEKSNLRELDYSKEWALLANPELASQEDDIQKSLQFIALSDGRIFARHHQPDTIRCIPFELENQWSLISSSADVSTLEKSSMRKIKKLELSADETSN